MPLFLFFNTQTMHINSIVHNSIDMYDFLNNLIPRRDSNNGLLFLRRMQCRLRHDTRENYAIYYIQYICM
jgi:hypothetical protein